MATITFFGAAQEVTGSCHLIESPAFGRVLLECGMKQGGDPTDRLKDTDFEFDPRSINAVILSHAHLDHSGILPILVNHGFSGPIYCTFATHELLRILLEDSWGLYERDIERENIRLSRRGKPLLEAEYCLEDVQKVLSLCEPTPYNTLFNISDNAQCQFYDAGHILGSAIVELNLKERGEDKRLVFSGDLGQNDTVLMNDPAKLTQADILLMEGTYGNRNHRTVDNTLEELSTILKETEKKGGNVMIPAFAVGRTQELLFHLGSLYQKGELDNWVVFLDSPMAIEVTQVYNHWLELLDQEDIKGLTKLGRKSLEQFLPTLQLCSSTEESIAINRIKKGAIIIAGSGMCTGGRIRHHLKHRIWKEKNTIIFVGFQAQGTLGRLLVDGKKNIKMFGDEFIVRANIATLNGFSAHAGQKELIEWAQGFQPTPRLVLIHGEATALEVLSNKLWDDHNIRSEIPAKGSSIVF